MPDQQIGDPVPTLGTVAHDGQHYSTAVTPSPAVGESNVEETKAGKRRFWGLGKKKDDSKAQQGTGVGSADYLHDPMLSTPMRSSSPTSGAVGIPTFSKTTSHPYGPNSPVRGIHSSSPAPPSPASSQIFERHVQEDSLAIREQAPIPGHITTENHIPPVLDASSEAITNDELDPDQVEIVMHSAHQPASVTVTGAPVGEVGSLAPVDEHEVLGDVEDGASTYGALDSTDVRRLSFISFADVVHAENVHDGVCLAASTTSPSLFPNRSPSPIRSPIQSQGSGSPYLGASDATSSGLGMSLMSPLAGHSPPPASSGELTIETMRQALRKTGSGDLSGARNASLSTTSHHEAQ